jgi:hypothetical protein
MQWTDDKRDEEQIHNILSYMMVRVCKGNNFAQAEWAATPAVLVYRIRSLVPPLQLDLVTFAFRYTLIALPAFIAITLSSRHTPSRTRTTVRWSRNHRCRRHLLLLNSVLLSTF